MSSVAVFWDRDNTLIKDPGYISDPGQVELLPGAAEALKRLTSAGFENIIITNQSGIARGFFDEAALERVHDRVVALFAEQGAKIDAIYFCPFLAGPEAKVEKYRKASELRKPKPGMIFQAALERKIELAGSWMVGDTVQDAHAGQAAGCRTILIRRPGAEPIRKSSDVDFMVDSIEKAAATVLKYTRRASSPSLSPGPAAAPPTTPVRPRPIAPTAPAARPAEPVASAARAAESAPTNRPKVTAGAETPKAGGTPAPPDPATGPPACARPPVSNAARMVEPEPVPFPVGDFRHSVAAGLCTGRSRESACGTEELERALAPSAKRGVEPEPTPSAKPEVKPAAEPPAVVQHPQEPAPSTDQGVANVPEPAQVIEPPVEHAPSPQRAAEETSNPPPDLEPPVAPAASAKPEIERPLAPTLARKRSETETPGDVAALLQEILTFLRTVDRRARADEFALGKLLGAVAQIVAIGALTWSIFGLIREEPIDTRLGFAILFQLMALTCFVLSPRK